MLIEFVAMDQEDWHKRLRELRYLNWDIKASRKTMADGRVRSFYTLKAYTDWPLNPSQWVRQYEQTRKNDKPAFKAMQQQAEKEFGIRVRDTELMGPVLNASMPKAPAHPPLDRDAAMMGGLLLGSPEFQRR
jgi:hypothetical protein